MTDEQIEFAPEDESEALMPEEEADTVNDDLIDEPSVREEDDAEESIDPYDAMSAVDREAFSALEEEWGTEFESNLALAQETAGAVADDDLIDLLEESGLGNDPRIIRAAAKIGRLLRIGNAQVSPLPSPEEREQLEATLDELSRSPDYWSDRVQRRVRQIHLTLHGDQPISDYPAIGDAGDR